MYNLYAHTHTQTRYLPHESGPRAVSSLFLPLLMIDNIEKKTSWCCVHQTQPRRRVRHAVFKAAFGMWNIKQASCQARSHGTFWWHALLFIALSAPFSLVLRVFLWLSALSLALFQLLFAVLARAFCLGLGPPFPSPTHILWVTAQRQNCPLPDFYLRSAGEVKLISEETQPHDSRLCWRSRWA